MVVLASLRDRCSQIIRYHNRLIDEQFILIYANFYCIAFTSSGTALHCRELVLASGFFVFFLSGAFFPSATSRFPEPRKYEHVCLYTPRARVFWCGVPDPCSAGVFSFLRRTFPLARSLVPPRLCPVHGKVCGEGAPFLSGSFLHPLFLSSELAGPSGNPPVVWSICRGRRSFRFVTLAKSSVATVRSRLTSTSFYGSIQRSYLRAESFHLRRVCTAVNFHWRFQQVPLNVRHFRGSCPMPRVSAY